ncbi:hypothetical protein KHA80_20490 [Anaerobacillus sp. HL2]|nr:hypothetical protein KHA80_20490 [Anaerobacillus sp. HL2]
MPQLVISKVRVPSAVAAGCQLVAASDGRSQVKKLNLLPLALIAVYFVAHPLYFCRNIGRKKAVELLFTGDFMTSEEALLHGLVNKVVPTQFLDEETENPATNYSKA